MELNIGDKVVYKQNDMLYEGTIKSIQGEKIEIADNTIKLIIAESSKCTVLDNSFDVKSECKMCRRFEDKSCQGTDYFRTKEHYFCIDDLKRFKRFETGTRFVNLTHENSITKSISPH